MTKPDYLATIEIVDDAHFRVGWAHGLPYRPYLIDRGDIEEVSSGIRNRLGALVNQSLARAKAVAVGDTKRVESSNLAQKDILQALVADCSDLFAALFTCAPGSMASQSYVNDHIVDQIRNDQAPKSICFLAPARVYVPWYLLYDGSSAVGANPVDPNQCPGFLCLRHQISVIFDALVSPHDFVTTYDSKAYHILSSGDPLEYRRAAQALRPYVAERTFIAKLLRGYGKRATTSNALSDAWQTHEKRLGLLYIFCHSDARTISFSPHDRMSVLKFKKTLTKSSTSPRCLVFLNGCYTANPDPKGTFFEATGREGFCGYIGAETEVPSVFAFRYGIAFQHLFLQGLEVVEIMDTLRRKHWPLSLVYGLYGFPHLRLTPNAEVLPEPLTEGNYSDGPLGEIIA